MWKRLETDEEHLGHRTSNEEAGHVVLHAGHDIDTNGKQTENVIRTDRHGEEFLEHCMRTDEKAGSIMLHVGHDMNENDEER